MDVLYKTLEEIGIDKTKYCCGEEDEKRKKIDDEYGNLLECENCTDNPKYKKIDSDKLIEWICKKNKISRKELVREFLDCNKNNNRSSLL